MTNPTDTAAAQALRTLAGKCYFSGRNQMNLARDTERDAETLAGPYGSAEAKTEAAESLHKTAARLIAAIEEQANRLPELRALSGVNGDATAVPKIADGGMAIVVQYRCPTNASGARWTARFDRDAETVFRASASFTFDDKDNEGSDVAAARCLAKFEDYCNEPIPEVIKTSTTRFALAARASLGRGSYAYTFRRI